MSTQRMCRSAGFSVLVLTAGAALIGCGETVPDDEKIKWMVSSAAAVQADEIISAVERGLEGEAWVQGCRDQRLTTVLMAMSSRSPLCREDGRYLAERGPHGEFAYAAPETGVEVLAECFRAPPGDRTTASDISSRRQWRFTAAPGDVSRLASVIWPEYINDLEWTVDGNKLVGTVEFEANGCWSGEVAFVARESLRGWRVEEFDLPVFGWTFRLESTGSWKATRTDRPPEMPDGEFVGAHTSGESIFEAPIGSANGPVPVGFSRDGSIEILAKSAQPEAPSPRAEGLDDRPVVLIGLEPDLVIGDFLAALVALRESDASIPVVGLVARGGQLPAPGDRGFDYVANIVTNAVTIRIGDEVDTGPRFCISPGAILVSTGQELPIPLYAEDEALEFAEYEVKQNGTLMFLVNAQSEAPFFGLEVVLDAVARAGGDGVFLSTDRFHGIPLLCRK